MGSVVISVEVDPELVGESPNDGTSDEDQIRLLDAWRRASFYFDRREIPATWLVAGELFAPTGPEISAQDRDDGDDRDGGTDEGDETKPQASEDEHGRFSRPMLPPAEEVDAPPCVHPDPEESDWPTRDSAGDWTQSARSVPELVAGIQRSHVGHEVGCLPFSGFDLGETSQDDAAAAVRATFDDAAALGVETDWLRSFGFPDGHAGHHDVLAAYGFECYPELGSKSGGGLSSLTTLLGLFVGRLAKFGPPLIEPETDEHGLVSVPTSLSLFPLAGRARMVAQASKRDPVVGLATRGIDRATEYDGVLHLSVRLSDLRSEADFDRLTTVLARVQDRRRESGLAVETLGQLARRLGEHAPTPTVPVR